MARSQLTGSRDSLSAFIRQLQRTEMDRTDYESHREDCSLRKHVHAIYSDFSGL